MLTPPRIPTVTSRNLGLVLLVVGLQMPGAQAGTRGALVSSAEVLTTLSTSQIDAATAAANVQSLTGKARCAVQVVGLNYHTIGPAQEATNVSGVLLLPGNPCTDAAPLFAYAKGTDVEKNHTLANPNDSQTRVLGAFFAAQGYAVVASDYLGFAKSSFAYHPYLHADTEASTVIDAIRAARLAATQLGAKLSGKVVVGGYSQGGHASMATQRAIEAEGSGEFTLLGGAHMAGPYNLSGALQSTTAPMGAQIFLPYLITSWQKVYGNLYSDINTVFQAPYVNGIENLLPNATLNTSTLISSGALPGASNETADQSLDKLLVANFRSDLRTNANNPVRQAALANDLLSWSPVANVLLCGSVADPTVPAGLHQNVLKAAFDAKSLSNVSSVDVDANIRTVFGTVLAFSPSTYYAAYHGTLEPAFCLAQAKQFADDLLSANGVRMAQADQVFNWAERDYASIFAPKATSGTIAGYRYRQYGSHYLAVNEVGNARVLYLGPLSAFKILDLGALADFVALAR